MLPFANMSNDPEQDYFADGIVEDVLTALSRESWLFVIARNSSFAYRGRAADIKQIGARARRALRGGRQRAQGGQPRARRRTAHRGGNGHARVGRPLRARLDDIFALQDEITQKIVAAVAPNLRAREIRRSQAKPTESLHAYDFFLRALPEIHAQTEASAARAEALLRQAVALDPGYPEALGMLADIIATRTVNGWHENLLRGLEESIEMAQRALAAGPENSTCLACAASTYVLLGRRFEEGWSSPSARLRLHPNSVFVRIRAGIALRQLRRGREGARELRDGAGA